MIQQPDRSIEALERTIVSVAARCLPVPVEVDGGTSFQLLGLDSLATIELAAALEAELGCELPADVMADCGDARTLAGRLARDGALRREQEDPFEQMLADAELPEEVRPPVHVCATTTDLRSAGSILLTGATGFLGRELLRVLLDTTSATVLCLVRPTHGGRRPIESDRIHVIDGDLSHPRLGLSEERFARLAGEVDAICHCAAAVNWVFSYATLRAANVGGTLELIRLACRRGAAFHFISSLSACYSTEGPRAADETFDPLPFLRGIHLGYAQTKVVAEALVREAGIRGLPVRIYRPGLISGHSLTGAFNRDDLITALVRGSLAMGTAPDLDWKLDCRPVDSVAEAIVHLSGKPGPVFHLGHERPRHWRECLLWMRTCGYDVRLLSHQAWLRQLERDTRPGAAGSASHPLRALRSFFLERPAGGHGLTLPELYEEPRRTRATGAATELLLRQTTPCPPLDATLLDTYFSAFRAAGEVPSPRRAAHAAADGCSRIDLDAGFFSEHLGVPVSHAEILSTGSEHSIVSELTAWESRRTSGLFRARVTLENGRSRDVMVKLKAVDRDVMAVGEALADLVDPRVGCAYRRWSDRIGFVASHAREIAIYRQRDPRFVRHAPALLASVTDPTTQTWMAILEHIDDAILLDSAEREDRWDAPHLASAVDGLAALQAIWLRRESELRSRPWIGYVQSTMGMAEMSDLWEALAEHSAPFFTAWTDPQLASIHRRLVAQVDRWWGTLEEGPRTLIHNDFNPRNICLRGLDGRLCAYDWELATIAAPQRDLVELLCFVLPTDASLSDVSPWIERHREALQRETGASIDARPWHEGFRSALYDLLVNRLALYTVVNRVRRQPFLPRVVRSWRNLYRLFPWEGRS